MSFDTFRSHPVTWKIFLLFIAAAASTSALADQQTIWPSVSELRLPAYKALALEHDLPVKDILQDTANSIWILGRRSLWHWHLSSNALKRIQLHPNKASDTELQQLGTDGVSLFVAANDMLYQLQFAPNRIFRYHNRHTRGHTLGFSGRGDSFHWLHTAAFFTIDRYGKRIEPKLAAGPFKTKPRKVIYDHSTRSLFAIHGSRLIQREITDELQADKLLLQAKHPLLDLQKNSHDLVVHTNHTVLRLSSGGKIKQSIPVEGNRKLLLMALRDDQHAYFFNDQLLEVFNLAATTAKRYRLPLEDSEQPQKLRIFDHIAALIVDGKPRIFRLSSPDISSQQPEKTSMVVTH